MSYLYHGTSAKLLLSIQANGLRPRALSKHKGNWKHTVQSNPKAVYLTDTYPFHFAAAAGNNKIGLILEIDRSQLLPWKLCPDEDVLEQTSRKQLVPGGPPLDWSMTKRTLAYRKIAPFNPDLADMSLKAMGTVAYYDTIPFAFVTRYVVIEWAKLDTALLMMAADTMVSVVNYRILQDRHKALVRWFFNEPVTVDDLSMFPIPDDTDGKISNLIRKQHEHLRDAMQNRAAVHVVTVKEPAIA